MESVKDLTEAFSTADAEDVTFEFDGCDLVLRFVDWREVPFEIAFPNTVLLRWDELLDDERFRFDSPHEIQGSNEISKRQLDCENFHHYMFCFNAASNLEIISFRFVMRKPAVE